MTDPSEPIARERSLAAFAPGFIVFVLGGAFATVVFANADDAPAALIVSGVVCALFALYGVDLMFRGAWGSPKGRGVFDGQLGLARAVLGTVTFGTIAIAGGVALIGAIGEGRTVPWRAGAGVVLFGLATFACFKGIQGNLSERRRKRQQ